MRALLLLLAACGAPELTLTFSQQALDPSAIQSLDVFVVRAERPDGSSWTCATLGEGPHYLHTDIATVRETHVTMDALALDELPPLRSLLVLADAYGTAEGEGPVLGSACGERVDVLPAKRTRVVLRFP